MLFLSGSTATKISTQFLARRAASSSATTPLEGLPTNVLKQKPDSVFKKTILDGGVEVVSVDSLAPSSRVGLVVRAGSRAEPASVPQGTSHVLSRLAYKSTQQSTAFKRTVTIESQTSKFVAHNGREVLRYIADLPRDNVNAFVSGPLLESLSPAVHEYELREIADVVRGDAENRTAVDRVLDVLHREAYDDRTLGRSNVCTHNVGKVSEAHVQQHILDTFVPSRIALVGVGVGDHNKFVELAQATIGAAPSAASRLEAVGLAANKEQPAASKYFGGRLRQASLGQSLTAIGFNTQGIDDVVLGVVRRLLGVAPIGSKRRSCCHGLLYKDAPAFSPAHAFQFHYSDGGLFGVVSATDDAPSVLQALSALNSVTQAQVDAAARSAALEISSWAQSHAALFDLLSYHAFSGDAANIESIQEIVARFEAVKLADVQKAIKQLSSSNPTIAAVGVVDNVVHSSDVQSAIGKK